MKINIKINICQNLIFLKITKSRSNLNIQKYFATKLQQKSNTVKSGHKKQTPICQTETNLDFRSAMKSVLTELTFFYKLYIKFHLIFSAPPNQNISKTTIV